MRRWGGLAVASALIVGLIGGSPAWADETDPSTPTGSISGVVMAESGDSTEGVVVEANLYHAEGYWDWQQSAVVGADGAYTLADLPDGQYRIKFMSGSAAVSLADAYWESASDLWDATDVIVSGGEAVAGISPVMTLGGTITGTVTAADGSAIPWSSVSATDAATGNYVGNAYADESGTYRLAGLNAGSYLLEFQPVYGSESLTGEWWDNKPNQWTATPVSVMAGEETAGINAVLESAGSITGTVTSDKGEPVQDAGVSVYYSDGSGSAGWAVTDAEGNYSITGIAPGTYTVEFSASDGPLLGEWYDNAADQASAKPVAVTALESTRADAVLATGGSIRGIVKDASGHPVANASVAALLAGEDSASRVATTAADGSYEITGLRSGQYRVHFFTEHAAPSVLSEWWKGATEAKATAVTVREGVATTGISPRLASGGEIRGAVRDDSGVPKEWSYVTVFDASGRNVAGGPTEADGSYRIGGLPKGEYRVRAAGGNADEPVWEVWWKKAASLNSSTPIAVGPKQIVSAVDLELSQAGGAVAQTGTNSLSGVLTDAQGHPIAGAYVTADSESMGDVAMTDENGAWTMPYLAAGSYRVSFTAELAGQTVIEWWKGATSRETATPIAINGEERTGIDAQIGPGALPAVGSAQPKITGQVRVGSTVHADPRGWTTGTTFEFQWFADGTPIVGATNRSMPVTADLVYKQLTVLVTGSLAGYQTVQRSSAPTAPVPAP